MIDLVALHDFGGCAKRTYARYVVSSGNELWLGKHSTEFSIHSHEIRSQSNLSQY